MDSNETIIITTKLLRLKSRKVREENSMNTKFLLHIGKMILPVILFLVLPIYALCLFHWNVRLSRKGKLVDKIPGPRPIPLFGNILSFMGPLGMKILYFSTFFCNHFLEQFLNDEFIEFFRGSSTKIAAIKRGILSDIQALGSQSCHD